MAAGRGSLLDSFARSLPFPLDGFQRKACQALEEGKNVLVSAPTGAGKTLVGEYAVYRGLTCGQSVFYTTPIKALSNQKFHDLCERYGEENVGLLTGDNRIRPDAPVIVMTVEVLRNMMYARATELEACGYVIFDEVHYLSDQVRGPVWEEVIIGLDTSIRVVALSATVSNARDVGAWLEEVRGATTVVISHERPVPLTQHMVVHSRLYDLYQGEHDSGRRRAGTRGAKRRRVNPRLISAYTGALRNAQRHNDERKRGNLRGSSRRWQKKHGAGRHVHIRRPSHRQIIDILLAADLLPAIVFIFSRQGCDDAVGLVTQSGCDLTTPEEKERIEQVIAEHTAGIPDSDRAIIRFDSWRDALLRGIAAHHAGMLPVFKETVEDLFVQGLVRVVYATETLALGINMPARSVVLSSLMKFNGVARARLTPGEYTQLTGRAGRRGIDTHGHAVVIADAQTAPQDVSSLASTTSYPLISAFTPSYNMAVNMLRTRDTYASARQLLDSSFAQFLTDREVADLAREVRDAREEADALREQVPACDCGDVAEFVQLRGLLAHAQKQARSYRRLVESAAATGGVESPQDDPQMRAHQQRIEDIRQRLAAHPCQACPQREQHAAQARPWSRADNYARRREHELTLRTSSLARTFDSICAVLVDAGYLTTTDEGYSYQLTTWGRILTHIHTERDLLVAECVRCGLCDNLSPAQLAALIGTIVWNPRSPLQADSWERAPSELVAQRLAAAADLEEDIAARETRHRLPHREDFSPAIAGLIEAWANGDGLADVLDGNIMSPGDFVVVIRRVVDMLGQIASLPHSELSDRGLPGRAQDACEHLSHGAVQWSGL